MANKDGTKSGGRQKGTVNKRGNIVRTIVEAALGESLPESILKDLKEIKDVKSRADVKLKLMDYAYPKMRAIEIKNDDRAPISIELLPPQKK